MSITDTSIYQDKIMGGVEGDPNPFGYQNQINDFVIDNDLLYFQIDIFQFFYNLFHYNDDAFFLEIKIRDLHV